ncbi:FUSC family protein [Streptomyces sp. NPDC002922]|uniref:FUSC family protein n=1 Tax=Streptomyces sp. NPDC002922 TaxID=3154439 RepID=UPI0033A08489
MTDDQRRWTHGTLRPSRSYLTRFRWRKLWQLGPFRWSDVAPWRAVRVAVGVMVPLTVGSALGRLDYGAFAALGALPAGFASFQGVTRSRVAAVAVAGTGMAVSTFVGAVTAAAAPWLLVPVVAVWGYVVGLAVCLGPRLSVAALQWPVGLLIATGMPLGPTEAALRAGLVLAGGLFQGVLVAVSWAFRRGDPERAALAESYRILAVYASGLAAGHFGPPSATALPAAVVLTDPNPLLPVTARLHFLDLLEQAERIRVSLAALAERAADDPSEAVLRPAADAARALDLIADTLSAGRAEHAGPITELNELLPSLAVASGTRGQSATEALFGQLRAVTRSLAGRFDTRPGRTPVNDKAINPVVPAGQEGIGWAALTLRANFALSGETGRHAVRLSVVAGLAEVMVQATGLFEGRWVVLTIFLVLKPDYTSTVYRSIQRAVGTAVGAGLGAAVASLAHPSSVGLIVAAGIAVAVAYALFDVNYVIYSSFLTVFIVILLDIFGLPADTTAVARLTNTAVGAVLALIAYSVWPTWEGLTAQEKFARMVEVHNTYTTALLRSLARPARTDQARLRGLQAAARRTRTDAEASSDRLADEPPHSPLTPTVARTLVAVVTRLAHTELSLHALVPPQATVIGREEDGARDADADRLEALAAAFDIAMITLAEAVRTLQPPGRIPPLRQVQRALRDRPTALDPRLLQITDHLVDTAHSLEDVLRRHLAPPVARADRPGT